METSRDKPRAAKRGAASDRDPVVDELARTLAKERELHAQQLALLRKESHEYREAAATAKQQEATLQLQLEQAKATQAKAKAAKVLKSDAPTPVSKAKRAVAPTTVDATAKAAKGAATSTSASASTQVAKGAGKPSNPDGSVPKAAATSTATAAKRTGIPRRAPLRSHLTTSIAARAQSMLEAVSQQQSFEVKWTHRV